VKLRMPDAGDVLCWAAVIALSIAMLRNVLS
jgi:hypothetical protein